MFNKLILSLSPLLHNFLKAVDKVQFTSMAQPIILPDNSANL